MNKKEPDQANISVQMPSDSVAWNFRFGVDDGVCVRERKCECECECECVCVCVWV
jgi:hypothetical protein